jgi:hypothetical protein
MQKIACYLVSLQKFYSKSVIYKFIGKIENTSLLSFFDNSECY